jgi:hypothetical protein
MVTNGARFDFIVVGGVPLPISHSEVIDEMQPFRDAVIKA